MRKFKNKMTRVRHRDLVETPIKNINITGSPVELAPRVVADSTTKARRLTKKERQKLEKQRIKEKHKLQREQAKKAKVESTISSTESSVHAELINLDSVPSKTGTVRELKDIIIDSYIGRSDILTGKSRDFVRTYSIESVFNNIDLLESYTDIIVAARPEFAEAAKKLIEDSKSKNLIMESRRNAELQTLIKEISMNKMRRMNLNNVRYTSSNNMINYATYVRAIYEVFKDEVVSMGINLASFRYCLLNIMQSDPWELYEEETKSSYNLSSNGSYRTNKFKSPYEIFQLAVSRCDDFTGYIKLGGFM